MGETKAALCGQGCALQNRDDVFGFNAKPLVAGSSYQWYSQVEYSVSAGRKRSPAMGNNVQEVRVGEETDGVVIESSMVIGGLSGADFVLAVAAELGVAPSSIRIVSVTDANSGRRKESGGVEVVYTVKVSKSEEAAMKKQVEGLDQGLIEGLSAWNPTLFSGKEVSKSVVRAVKESERPVVVVEEEDEGLAANQEASSSGGSGSGGGVGVIVGAVVGCVVLVAGVVVAFRKQSGELKTVEKEMDVDGDVDDIEISLHG